MAIITHVPTDRTFFTDQYVRVDRIYINSKHEMTVEFGVYSNESTKDFPPHRMEHLTMPFDVEDTSNLWSKAYAEAKKIWPMAVDC